MNPAMLIILVIACVLLWFLLANYYKSVGGVVKDIGENAINEMREEAVEVNFTTEREELDEK